METPQLLETQRRHHELVTGWDIDLANFLKDASTEAEQTQKTWQFIAENADRYRERRALSLALKLHHTEHDHTHDDRFERCLGTIATATRTIGDAQVRRAEVAEAAVVAAGNGVETKVE